MKNFILTIRMLRDHVYFQPLMTEYELFMKLKLCRVEGGEALLRDLIKEAIKRDILHMLPDGRLHVSTNLNLR